VSKIFHIEIKKICGLLDDLYQVLIKNYNIVCWPIY